ncbi:MULTISPECIES: energy-coupling factor transporter transmembrane protein EcfT [Terrabacteria group]|uniref:energy-coupling factor transporter transmembrane component T family protein n=1 Tax=Bacillati TaxID=1783272 RepID=UPI001939F256|nr:MULTISPECIES: energy-coupling factor transporter transmembrane component T [Terrabacteria group]MBW9213070.1 energy-coupling factor transporter transmembrane protein EcfT [Trueperella sp. zg.1013]QRG87445.1 energy-coupling factor transporter transmembrane protein EcfT [Bulleidia sp. zg-1006]
MEVFQHTVVTSSHKRFHPLSILALNVFIPVINSVFPSQKGVIFTFTIAFLVLLFSGKMRRFCKGIFWILIFFTLYYIVGNYFYSPIAISFFRMLVLFLPTILLASVIIYDYNSSELLSALQQLKLPKILIIAITVTLRYIPTFAAEFRLIKDSMRLRGVDVSFYHPIRSFEYLLVPQLFRCLTLSSQLTIAGLSKGIAAKEKRTSYFEQSFQLRDVSLLALVLIGYGAIVGGLV